MVKQIDVPTFSGHLGVLREHVPIIAMLQPGVLAIHGETTQKYFGKKLVLVTDMHMEINEGSLVPYFLE